MRIPEDASVDLPLARPGVHLIALGGALRVASVVRFEPRERADELYGVVAVSWLADLGAVAAQLAPVGGGARLETPSGTIQLGMVVAADADPEPGRTEGYDFPALGGAILLSADRVRGGFTGFLSATFPEHGDQFVSAIDWRAEDGGGRNVLTVEVAKDYPARALDCGEQTARQLLAAHRVEPGESPPNLRISDTGQQLPCRSPRQNGIP